MVTRNSLTLLFLSLGVLCGCAQKYPEGLFYDKRDLKIKFISGTMDYSDMIMDDEAATGRTAMSTGGTIKYIELKSDGTFFLKQQRQIVGKFQAEEGGITLVFEGGQADRWQMNGDTLTGGGSTYILWERGKNGFEFEQKVNEVLSQFRETDESLNAGKITQEKAAKDRFDLLVTEGFMSREEADREIERRKPGGKDDIVADLTNLAANAYQYRIRPRTMGGGGGNFLGYSVPSSLASNENATYSASVSAQYIIFTGTSLDRQGSVSAKAGKDGHLSGLEYTGKFK